MCTAPSPTSTDPITCLFELADALRYLHDTLGTAPADGGGHPGAAVIAGMLSDRASSIASTLWDAEETPPAEEKSTQPRATPSRSTMLRPRPAAGKRLPTSTHRTRSSRHFCA
jgi:hypothetical protein